MALSEPERYRLHEMLADKLGPEITELLMTNLPPVPWTELATKADLARLAGDVEANA